MLGTWAKFNVYPIDFTLGRADIYTISVGLLRFVAPRPHSASIQPENLYSTPLANNLYFYENERDGADFIPTPLRTAAGHLNDAHATVYNSPSFDDDDNIIGSLVPDRRNDQRRRRMVGCRRLPQIRADGKLRRRVDADRRARLSAPDGPSLQPLELH